MSFFRHIRLFPLLIVVAALSFVVRAGNLVSNISGTGPAFAQQEVDAHAPPLPHGNGEGGARQEHSDKEEGDNNHKNMEAAPSEHGEGGVDDIKWQDASEAQFEYSEARAELFQDLASRREDLDKREREIAMKEALLRAAERELEQKLRELTAVRNEIQNLLQQQSEEEEGRIMSLVRIYEGMKSKDAARIFNTLDTDVLISVMSRMSERKSAPILAEMDADRARSVTILLAQQKALPSLMQ